MDDADLEDVTVPAITFDDLVSAQKLTLQFLKVDIEGLDYQVLLSSSKIFESRAGISFEVAHQSPLSISLWNKFQQNNYIVCDCFFNELDDSTFFTPIISPTDRFALPREAEFIAAARERVHRIWEHYDASSPR